MSDIYTITVKDLRREVHAVARTKEDCKLDILEIGEAVLKAAKPLITCGSCHWAGRPNDLGFRSCYWDPRRGKIYPEDYYCKLATIEGEQDVPPDDRRRWFETCPSAEVPE